MVEIITYNLNEVQNIVIHIYKSSANKRKCAYFENF